MLRRSLDSKVRAHGHVPGNAALKCVYMALMSLDLTEKGRKPVRGWRCESRAGPWDRGQG
jgi:hypothetical protein